MTRCTIISRGVRGDAEGVGSGGAVELFRSYGAHFPFWDLYPKLRTVNTALAWGYYSCAALPLVVERGEDISLFFCYSVCFSYLCEADKITVIRMADSIVVCL